MDSYIIIKSTETKKGRVAIHKTTNIEIPFIVTAIYKDIRIPKDIKCISYIHANAVYEFCCSGLHRVVLKNGLLLEVARA